MNPVTVTLFMGCLCAFVAPEQNLIDDFDDHLDRRYYTSTHPGPGDSVLQKEAPVATIPVCTPAFPIFVLGGACRG